MFNLKLFSVLYKSSWLFPSFCRSLLPTTVCVCDSVESKYRGLLCEGSDQEEKDAALKVRDTSEAETDMEEEGTLTSQEQVVDGETEQGSNLAFTFLLSFGNTHTQT